MAAKPLECIYCHRPFAGQLRLNSMHRYVCDLCAEAIRTHKPLLLETPSPPSPADKRKAERKRTRKARALTILLLLLLAPLVGCTIHRTTQLDLELDPAFFRSTGLDLQQPTPGPTAVQPTDP